MRPFYTPHQLRHDHDDILFINEHWDEIKEAYFQVLEALKAPDPEVSWDKVTNKPTLATVATSGSYTDLSNTPTIPTKVSQLENDMGFGTGGGSGDTSDCVHKTGNETIDGVKTFTSGPCVTNNQTTMGFSINNTALARNEVPSELYHATFRALDKNNKILGEYCVEKSTTGSTLLNMNVHSEDSNGEQLSESLYLNMSNDGSAVRFYPSSNNKMDLGMSDHKWAKIYSDDVVHTSGDETIAGIKTFSNKIKGNLQGNADTATSANSVEWENVTGKPNAYVTETWTDGTSGYRVYSDGFCEQWGFVSENRNVVLVTVNLHKAYKDTNYTLNTEVRTQDTTDDMNYSVDTNTNVQSITTTRFNVNVWEYSYDGVRLGFYWHTWGYVR